jgi:type IV pilus assembly protein PilE
MKRMRGVTLIELVIVMLVLSIISTYAVSSYRNYIRRAQRIDAMEELLRVRGVQEKFFVQNNAYADTAQLTALGLIGPSEHGHFLIDLAAVTKTSYTIRATATGGQIEDAPCRTFTIDERGVRVAKTSAGLVNTTTCWR